MRYRVVVSRLQVAERTVRAASEEGAIKQIQSELDRPYGFFGAWRTTNIDIDVVGVESRLDSVPPPLAGDGKRLLSLKEAAAHLGISYSALYELVASAEVPHVAVGRRRYVSRDALNSFIEAHTRLGRADA